MSYSTRMKGLLGGAALSLMLLPALSSSASACAGSSFIDAGCFTSVSATLFYNAPDGHGSVDLGPSALSGNYVQVFNNNGQNPVLQLSGASGLINYVSLWFKAGVDNPSAASAPFTLSLQGFGSISGAQQFTVQGTNSFSIASSTEFIPVTFFSATGISGNDLSISFQAKNLTDGSIYAELGHIAVSAPAPIPGAGFLSFLGMGFAGMFRRGRSLLSRLAMRKPTAQVA